MSWKEELQLRDLPAERKIGFRCKKCNLSQPKLVQELLLKFEPVLYLDEVEARLICRSWGCGGALMMELEHTIIMEGFQGGLA